MKVSMIMSTLGRTEEVLRFIDALEHLGRDDFELIIVDQNPDGRVRKACAALTPGFALQCIASPHAQGVSRGRNLGIAKARGEILCFPDDDCIYPPALLGKVMRAFEESGADIVCGRAATPEGRSINGRFESRVMRVDMDNVFTTQIEWVVFFRRRVFEKVRGYDEDIGLGADTPWQACEGPDITIRAMRAGFAVHYDPDLFAHHAELNTQQPDRAMRDKGRRYARGMGYVIARHGYGWAYKGRYLVRPLGGACLALLQGKLDRVLYYLNVALGRAEGYAGTCMGGPSPSPQLAEQRRSPASMR